MIGWEGQGLDEVIVETEHRHLWGDWQIDTRPSQGRLIMFWELQMDTARASHSIMSVDWDELELDDARDRADNFAPFG